MASPPLGSVESLKPEQVLQSRRESLHKELRCLGFVDRISTDVEPDQMACGSETEGGHWRRERRTHSQVRGDTQPGEGTAGGGWYFTNYSKDQKCKFMKAKMNVLIIISKTPNTIYEKTITSSDAL